MDIHGDRAEAVPERHFDGALTTIGDGMFVQSSVGKGPLQPFAQGAGDSVSAEGAFEFVRRDQYRARRERH